MKKPFISVIVPALNEENYIENTLRAIKNQDYKGDYEIIVADGMSTDKTTEIAKKYADKVIRVKKKGIGAGRNAGVLHAKGNILVFVDADTMPSANLFSNLLQAFRKKDVVLVGCKLYPINPDKSIVAIYKLYNKFMKLSIKFNVAGIAGMCCAYRRSIFEQLDGFNENLDTFEDADLSRRADKLGNVILLKNSIALTSSRRIEKWGSRNAFFSYMFNFIKFYLIGKGYTSSQYRLVR